MSRNICIFADGTGQGGSVGAKDNTNVWRLYCATDKVDPGRTLQVCHYDTGLGAKSGEGWGRWVYDKLSQATGLGISQNIKECYDFVLKEYRPGDRIFLFGFSRGAYTVRSLGGVLKLCGVPTSWRDKAGEAAQKKARLALVEEAVETVYKHYGDGEKQRERIALGARFRTAHKADEVAPFFIGVWDTVRSLGIPGSAGMTGWYRHAFHDATLDPRVPRARQALSIDENREAFRPEIWDAAPGDIASGRIAQCWFPGVHSDIGGGYADDGRLADLALRWIVDEATTGIAEASSRLLVDEAQIPTISPEHPLAIEHDELYGFSLWRRRTREEFHDGDWRARAILADPSVLHRLRAATVPSVAGNRIYRPVSLKSRFDPDYTIPP